MTTCINLVQGGYHQWLKAEFDKRGWRVELQAPNGPYTNVLDLQLFPAMSKRHSKIVQLYSNTPASQEKIWRVAKSVWDGMNSALICRAFVLAIRIMRHIVAHNGDNAWLANGTPYCNVRRDFLDTDTGLIPRKKQMKHTTTAGEVEF